MNPLLWLVALCSVPHRDKGGGEGVGWGWEARARAPTGVHNGSSAHKVSRYIFFATLGKEGCDLPPDTLDLERLGVALQKRGGPEDRCLHFGEIVDPGPD